MPDQRVARDTVALSIAWTGALLFAASLAWAAYSYGVRFDRLTPGLPAATAIVWNTALFSVFALHHSLFARTGLKALVSRAAPAGLERSIYTWIASTLFFAVCLWWQPIDVSVYEIRPPWRLAAYAVQLAGVVLTMRGSARLDLFDLAGIRQVERARSGQPPRHTALETDGVYGFVRHPLYFAWLLIVFAAPVMTGTRLAFAIITTTYLAIAIPWEERSLILEFGADYRAYQRKVRWRMLPGIY